MRKYIYAALFIIGLGFVPNGKAYAHCPYPITHYRPSRYICEWNKPTEIDVKKLLMDRIVNTNKSQNIEVVSHDTKVSHDTWTSCATGSPGVPHTPSRSALTDCH